MFTSTMLSKQIHCINYQLTHKFKISWAMHYIDQNKHSILSLLLWAVALMKKYLHYQLNIKFSLKILLSSFLIPHFLLAPRLFFNYPIIYFYWKNQMNMISMKKRKNREKMKKRKKIKMKKILNMKILQI